LALEKSNNVTKISKMRGYVEVTVHWIRIADGADKEAHRNGATLPKPDTQQFMKSKLALIEALVVTNIICQVPSQQFTRNISQRNTPLQTAVNSADR